MMTVSGERLTRAQQQERTRAAVLAAARDEFTDHGYGEVTVDRIAERAALTRGAVYSNFPSKRALYLAVLADQVERTEAGDELDERPSTVAGGLGAFARAWLDRLPLTVDPPAGGRLRLRSLAGAFEDGEVLAEVARLEALLLALALESLPSRRRRVRLADLVLTMLAGAGHRAEAAPGSVDAFDVARGCAHLAGLDLPDADPPHLSHVGPARPVRDAWMPPSRADLVTGGRADLEADGVVAVLGSRRLGAAEEAVRAARPEDRVSLLVVTSDPAETGRLVRLRIADVIGCLHRSMPAQAWPRCQIVLDEDGQAAAAVGVREPGDTTEVAARVRGGRVTARAHGRGAGHAAGMAR